MYFKRLEQGEVPLGRFSSHVGVGKKYNKTITSSTVNSQCEQTTQADASSRRYVKDIVHSDNEDKEVISERCFVCVGIWTSS